MRDVPKRIWTTGTETTGSWNVESSTDNWKTPVSEVEYIRADIHEAKIKALALRIAKLESVVNKLWRRQDSLDTFDAAVNEILSPLFEEQPHE